ncbi:MAG: universal stress protein [Haloferacaceae archaeon]
MSVDTVVLAVAGENTDLTDRLAQTTGDIAAPADADVALVRVYTEAEYDQARTRLDFAPDSEATPDAIAERDASVRAVTDTLSADGLDASVHGRLAPDADTGERIVELTEAADADLLVVGGRQRSPAGKALFGSTAQELMLNAPCPVTFVRAD